MVNGQPALLIEAPRTMESLVFNYRPQKEPAEAFTLSVSVYGPQYGNVLVFQRCKGT